MSSIIVSGVVGIYIYYMYKFIFSDRVYDKILLPWLDDIAVLIEEAKKIDASTPEGTNELYIKHDEIVMNFKLYDIAYARYKSLFYVSIFSKAFEKIKTLVVNWKKNKIIVQP